MPLNKAIKNKAAPKKPTRGRKPTKKASEFSTNNNAAEKTTGHLNNAATNTIRSLYHKYLYQQKLLKTIFTGTGA